MRSIHELNRNKASIEYDPNTGTLVSTPMPQNDDETPGELTLDETLAELEQVVPFPQPIDLGT